MWGHLSARPNQVQASFSHLTKLLEVDGPYLFLFYHLQHVAFIPMVEDGSVAFIAMVEDGSLAFSFTSGHNSIKLIITLPPMPNSAPLLVLRD